MPKRTLVGVVVVALLLSGCWDRREIEDSLFIASIGVDVAGDEYLWTMRASETERLPLGMLTSTPGGPGGLAGGVFSVRAVSLQQAIQLLQPGIMRVLSFEHVRWIAFGQELAEKGVEPVLSQLLRHHQIRRGTNLYIVRGSAVAPFLSNRPVADINPMRFFEGANLVQKRFRLSPPVQLQHFYTRLSAPGVDPITAVVGINEMAQAEPGTDLPPMGDRSLLAGEVPRRGGNPVEFMGTGIFRGDRLAGLLTVDETAAVLALRGEMGKVYQSIADPQEPDTFITFRLHQENKPRYQAFFRNGRPVVHVSLQFEVEILGAPGKTDYSLPKNRRALERHIEEEHLASVYKELIAQVYTEWGADPAALGQLFRSRFATFGDWIDYRWHEHIQEMEITVETKVFIRRFGLLLSSEISE